MCVCIILICYFKIGPRVKELKHVLIGRFALCQAELALKAEADYFVLGATLKNEFGQTI